MNYWSDIKAKLNDHIVLASQLLLVMLGVYIFIMAEKYSLWKVPILFVGLLSWFFFRDKTKHPIIWIVFFIMLFLDLFLLYFRVANHHFMLTFMMLSVLLYSYHKRSDILLKNIQILLVVVVMASALQKLMSSQFMSGNFYYYMFNRGYLFTAFLKLFPESLEIAKSNVQNIIAFQATDPNLVKTLVLKDSFPNLGLISLVFAWVTVIVEFIVAVAVLFKPRSTWTHLLFATMIIGIICTRLEMGFMALLAICGVFLCNNLRLRLLYVMIAIGCITLIVTKIGYH